MRPLCGMPLLLLLLICQLVTPTPIFDIDGAGPHHRHRSVGFGETVRDWFRMLKDRIVGKWNEWFGDEPLIPTFSTQDILNIDKTLEKGIQGYPDLIKDLCKHNTFNNMTDTTRIFLAGNTYGPSCDTDEWDLTSWIPTLPSFPSFDDWPDIGFGKPEPPSTLTPRTEFTTTRTETTLRPFDEDSTTATQTTITGTTVSIAESTTTSVKPTPPVTQVTTAASTEAVTSESTVSTTESTISTTESTVSTTESTVSTTESTVSTTESTVSTTESIASTTELTITSTEPTLISEEPTTVLFTESIATSDESESSATSSTESTLTSTEPTTIASESTTTFEETTTTESPTTPFDLSLPVYSSKRVEDNETIEKPTKKPKNRPSSVEVIM